MEKVNIRIKKEGVENLLKQTENDLSSNSFTFKIYKERITELLEALKHVSNTNKNERILNDIIELSKRMIDNNNNYKSNKIYKKNLEKIYKQCK